jgi:PiT family inorganic phosphate transporter
VTLSFLLCAVLLLAFIFGVTNGFLDGGGLVSTVVSTRILEPLPALILVAVCEVVGLLLLGKAVAWTVSRQLVSLPEAVPSISLLALLLSALFGALVWNLVMWRLSMPSSSSHALIGSLAGATVAFFGFAGVHWDVLAKIVLFLALVPTFGLVASFFLCRAVYFIGAFMTPSAKSMLFRLQIGSLAVMAMAHGSNDGQKTLALMMLAYTAWAGHLVSDWPIGLTLLSGGALAIGIVAGSQRTLRTMGRRFFRVQQAQAFSAGSSAMVLLGASSLAGIPMSSAHLMSASVVGSGVALRPRGVRWGTVGEMAVAWLVTIPCAGLLSWSLACLLGRWVHVVS